MHVHAARINKQGRARSARRLSVPGLLRASAILGDVPKRFERHARSRWEWGAPGSRRGELARAVSDDAPGKAPGKKNGNLCKAAHWKGPHQPALRMRDFGWRRSASCKWAVSWLSKDGEPSWHCGHEEFCSGCGKVLRTGIDDGECPDFHPITDQGRAAIEAKRAEDEAQIAAARTRDRWQPKPAVTGPQGYRRRKAG